MRQWIDRSEEEAVCEANLHMRLASMPHAGQLGRGLLRHEPVELPRLWLDHCSGESAIPLSWRDQSVQDCCLGGVVRDKDDVARGVDEGQREGDSVDLLVGGKCRQDEARLGVQGLAAGKEGGDVAVLADAKENEVKDGLISAKDFYDFFFIGVGGGVGHPLALHPVHLGGRDVDVTEKRLSGELVIALGVV